MKLQEKLNAIEQDFIEMRRANSPNHSPKRHNYMTQQPGTKPRDERHFMHASNGFEALYEEENKEEEVHFDK